MNERRRLFLILLFPFLIFFAYLFFQNLEPNFFISDYQIQIDLDENIMTVNETLQYTLNSNNFRELYRTYEKSGPQQNLQIITHSCPKGSLFFNPNYNSYQELICKDSTYFNPGTYSVSFLYEIPSPYVCYADYCEIFWTIMNDFNSKIQNINIEINGDVLDVTTFPYTADDILSLKEIPKNSLFEIKILVEKENVQEIYEIKTENLEPLFITYSNLSLFYSLIYKFKNYLILISILLSDFLLYRLFLTKGKEKEFQGIPDVLHFAPSKLKPYEVDFLFSGNIGAFEGNVIDATLLDLIKRGYFKIKGDTIKIIKSIDSTLTPFELRIVKFYSKYAENEVFNAKTFKKQVSKMSQVKARNILNELNELRNPTIKLLQQLNQMFNTKPKKTAITILGITGTLSMISLLISKSLDLMYIPDISLVLLIIHSLWIFVLIKLDNYVFGKYNDNIIEEKLKWDAFKNLFKNYSMIEKYKPDDLAMWGDWLSYATIFGLAKNVIKAIKIHKIKLPNLDDPMRISRINRMIWQTTRIAATPKSSSSGFSGGIGGGFGGGGGGAR